MARRSGRTSRSRAREYGDSIATKNEKMKLLDERLDVNQMSAAQLKKRLKELHNEYRNTTKAIDNSRSTP